jgi:hypothetical protein
LPFSPSAVTATPVKIENTTICRISLFAIASTIERGTMWITNSFSVSEEVLRLVETPASGSGRFKLSPGRSRLTITIPSVSDTSEADTNQPMALSPMRPIDSVSPMWAIPTTSIENTSGAMIILIRRRNSSVMIEK